MKPLPFNQFAKYLNINHPSQVLIKGVAIDSRQVKEGDLFFALPGNRVDGQAFIQDAVSRGAIGAVVTEQFKEKTEIPLLKVSDVLKSLQECARKHLEKRSVKVIAITGSLGKTTTKDFTATLLRSYYRVFASPLSYNSQATVPLNIFSSDEQEEILVLEMGMSEPGQIKRLIEIAPPDLAAVTMVAVQHATHFSDGLQGIAREKGTIFTHPKTQLGILRQDSPFFEQILRMGNCPKQTFSLHDPRTDYYLKQTREGVQIYTKEETIELMCSFPIQAQFQNLLAAIALARACELPWKLIQENVKLLRLPPMRFEHVIKEGIHFINDAYNANPDSMIAALESLPTPIQGRKKLAVLSEMDALGIYSEAEHRRVGEVAFNHVDSLFCLGERCENMCQQWSEKGKEAYLFSDLNDLKRELKKQIQQGDVVLLKGARAYALDQLLKHWEN